MDALYWKETTGVSWWRCPVFGSNTFLIPDPRDPGSKCVMVDPGLDREGIEAFLTASGLVPSLILCTHAHFDHLGSAAYFQQRFGIEVMLHADDAPLLQKANFMLMVFKLPQRIQLPQPTLLQGERGSFASGARRFAWRHSPGHTAGSCIFETDSFWFTGDTLFTRGLALSRLPGENPEQLRATLRQLSSELVPGRTIFPGHAWPGDAGQVAIDNGPLRQFLEAVPEPAAARP